MQVWYPTRRQRKDMARRAQGQGMAAVIESLTAFAWAGSAFLLIEAPRYAPLSLAAALLGCGAVWLMGTKRREAAAQPV